MTSATRGLVIDALEKQFGVVQALDGMAFEVEEGQLVGFLGPNGSGKTTTMRSILGLVRLDAGEVRWRGRPVDAEVRSRFGYMPEERGLYPRMATLEQVVYFARLGGLDRREADAAARRWLEALGLAGRLGDEVGGLSHGNQQRVQLAVALVHDPELLVLDEPLSGLDPIAADTMQRLLADQADQGTSVLFSSHQLDMVEEVCRDVVIVDRGRVLAAGPVDRLRAAEPIRTLTVTFASAGPGPGWADGIPGSTPLSNDDDHHVLEVPADIDLGAALARASSEAPIDQFSFEPPDLSVVFRHAVARAEEVLV